MKKVINHTITNLHGFSLVEVMVTVGIVAIGAMAMSQVMVQNARNQQKVAFDQSVNDAMREIGNILSRSDVCTANFSGLSPTPITPPPGDNPDMHRLHYLKYNVQDGLSPSNVIAQIGPSAPPYRNGKLRITDMTLMPQATTGEHMTYIDKTSGTGSLFIRVKMEYAGAPGAISGTKTFEKYIQLFANFTNIIPAGAVSFFFNQAGDSIALAAACQEKADKIACSTGLLTGNPCPPAGNTNHPITGILGATSSYVIVQSPYNGVPFAIQDCILFNSNEPIVASCNAMNN